MEDYIERSTEDDFLEDDSMYEGLPFGEVDETVGKIAAHGKTESRKHQGTKERNCGHTLFSSSRFFGFPTPFFLAVACISEAEGGS